MENDIRVKVGEYIYIEGKDSGDGFINWNPYMVMRVCKKFSGLRYADCQYALTLFSIVNGYDFAQEAKWVEIFSQSGKPECRLYELIGNGYDGKPYKARVISRKEAIELLAALE